MCVCVYEYIYIYKHIKLILVFLCNQRNVIAEQKLRCSSLAYGSVFSDFASNDKIYSCRMKPNNFCHVYKPL